MKTTVIVTTFGLVAFDENDNLVGKMFFSKKPETAAKSLADLQGGKSTDEVAKLVSQLQPQGYDVFIFEDKQLAVEVHNKLNVETEQAPSSAASELVSSRTGELAVGTGFVRGADEFSVWSHDLMLELAKLRVKGAVEKRDLVVGQAIQALDDLDRELNLLMNRVREWYGVHFPELDRLLEKHETYARLVLNLGNRASFKPGNLKTEGIPEVKAEGIAKTAEKSMGAELTDVDLEQIRSMCKNVLSLYDLRQGLESYLDRTMDEVAPSTKVVAGSLLGARLIAISGGLINLARKPASTIQVLGAEKALFRSLKTGTRPPKHGLIFQHNLLHDAKRWQRGKIARALAGKIAIAARADAFGHRDIGAQLKADLDKRVEEIRTKYAEPPVVAPTPRPSAERIRFEGKRGKRRRER